RIEGTEKYLIYDIYEDANRTMWFATNNFGLLSQSKKTGEWQQFTADGKKGSLSSAKLIMMLDDGKGNLWLGTEGGGLNRFSLKTKTAEVIGAEKGLPAKI